MRISLLYVDDCPHRQLADTRLAEALRLAARADQSVEQILITTDEEAQAAHFRGSPTILIDDEDPFACDAPQVFGLTCRLYGTPDGLVGSPSVAALVAAIEARIEQSHI